jgi:hypothetical protein
LEGREKPANKSPACKGWGFCCILGIGDFFAFCTTIQKDKIMPETTIASLAGVIISLVFSYIPGVSDWYANLNAQYKSLWMLAFLLIACGVLFGAGCLGYSSQVACTAEGAKSLVPLFIAAAIANQATYLISPQKSK